MNRRTFLRGAGGFGAAVAVHGVFGVGGGRATRRRHLPPPVNTSPVEAEVVSASDTALSVAVRTRRADSRLRLFAVRRRFPSGPVIGGREQPVDVDPDRDGRAAVQFNFPSPSDESGNRDVDGHTPWYYAVYLLPPETDTDRSTPPRYLCESDPRGGEIAGPRRDASVRDDSNRVRRVELEGAYHLSYRWPDPGGRVWRTAHRVSKSAYGAARRDRSGLVTTYERTVASPHVAAFTRRLLEGATAGTGDRPGDRTHAERFRLVVNFVQHLPYVTDIESTGNHDHYRRGLELLVDGAGDCEDSAVLLAGMLESNPFDCRTALLFPPGHALLAVRAADVPFEPAGEGIIRLRGTPYVPIETTVPRAVGRRDFEALQMAYVDGAWTEFDLVSCGQSVLDTAATRLRGGSR